MLPTFAKLRGQMFGRGKATVVFSKSYRKLEPEDQVSTLDQAMRQLMDERKRAARRAEIKRKQEDARNAAAIREARA